jgi:hypothetical protein
MIARAKSQKTERRNEGAMVPGQLLPGSGHGGRPLPKASGQAPEVIRLLKTGKLSLQEIVKKVRPSKTTVDEILKRRGQLIPVQVHPDLTPTLLCDCYPRSEMASRDPRKEITGLVFEGGSSNEHC